MSDAGVLGARCARVLLDIETWVGVSCVGPGMVLVAFLAVCPDKYVIQDLGRQVHHCSLYWYISQ